MSVLLELLPVGWGFAGIQFNECRRCAVVIDGGSIPACMRAALQSVRFEVAYRMWPADGNWFWVISHFDYDHYSIVATLLKEGIIKPPLAVFLPESLSSRYCREGLALLYATVELLPLRIPRLIPVRPADLPGILKNVGRIYGLHSGLTLDLCGLRYRVIWPPPRSYSDVTCRRLVRELRERFLSACRSLKGGSEGICDRILANMEEIRKDMDILSEKMQTSSREEYFKDIPEPIRRSGAIGRELERESEDVDYVIQPYWEPEEDDLPRQVTLKGAAAIFSYKSGVREFFKLALRVLNVLSLAFVIQAMADSSTPNTCIYVNNIKKENKILHFTSLSVEELKEFHAQGRSDILLYPADLGGTELDSALNGYILSQSQVTPLVEVAPHHGNAYSRYLREVRPLIAYIPRCDKHTPLAYRSPKSYRRYMASTRYRALLTLSSGHSTMLGLRLNSCSP
ncbi:MAG: hypothetical protein LRS46_00200 [Desulfurococcales archaeon]|nr:hypothetical protein [Desulfurococcales archaeon]